MSTVPVTTVTTNVQAGSLHEITLTCDKLWAMGQETAIRRLSVETRSFFGGSSKQELVSDFGARAGRIAATYARFYLEREEDGKAHLKGRFYWMGLAAFASKQVKCGLDFIPKEPYLTLVTPPLAQPALRIGKTALGKGNFWLFQDIFVWHWFYSKYPDQFTECAPERNATAFEDQVQHNIDNLPWATEALSKLNNLAPTPEVIEAFRLTALCESRHDIRSEQEELKYQSLLQIANHEQLKILQPLIYDLLPFRAVLKAQAIMEIMPFVPQRAAAFSMACDIENSQLREQMTEGNLYDSADRMKFITRIAEKYHRLMTERRTYMEGVITGISAWQHMT